MGHHKTLMKWAEKQILTVRGKAVPRHSSYSTDTPLINKRQSNRAAACSSTEYTKAIKAIQNGSKRAFVLAKGII
jgi:hypothetical protein